MSIGLGEKELMRTIKEVVIEVEIEVLVDTEKGSQDLNSSTTSQSFPGLLERKTGGTLPQITQL